MINYEQQFEQLLKYVHDLSKINLIKVVNNIIIQVYELVTNKVQMLELNLIPYVVLDDFSILLIHEFDQTRTKIIDNTQCFHFYYVIINRLIIPTLAQSKSDETKISKKSRTIQISKVKIPTVKMSIVKCRK